jgi:hypothetical protein
MLAPKKKIALFKKLNFSSCDNEVGIKFYAHAGIFIFIV